MRNHIRDTHNDGFGVVTTQLRHDIGIAECPAYHADQHRDTHRDHHPHRRDPAGQLQLFLVLDRHKAQQDVRHTEVAQSPRQGGDDMQQVIRIALTGGFRIRRRHRQIPRQIAHIVDNRIDPARGDGGIHQHKRNGKGHDDALDKVGGGSREEAARRGVSDNDHRRHQHRHHIIHTEQRREQLAAGGKAGRGIRNKEHDDDDCRHAGQDVFLIAETARKELRQSERIGLVGVAAQPTGGEQPVKISTHRQTDGGPAHIRQTGQIRQPRQTHQQVAGHIARLGAHRRDQRAKLASAQIEILRRLVFPRIAETDEQHTEQVHPDRRQNANG